jgi:hypothetical protein
MGTQIVLVVVHLYSSYIVFVAFLVYSSAIVFFYQQAVLMSGRKHPIGRLDIVGWMLKFILNK